MFEELQHYKAKHGYSKAPHSAGKLGIWVNNQRYQYRLHQEGKHSSMTGERIQKLESIGFRRKPRRSENKSAGGATDMKSVSTSTPDDAHHGVTEASFNDHITHVDCQLNDCRDILCDATSTPDDAHNNVGRASSNDRITNLDCQLNDSRVIPRDEPDVVISSTAASKVDSEFRPFLLGG